jgi:hypothetical protein
MTYCSAGCRNPMWLSLETGVEALMGAAHAWLSRTGP